MDADDPGDRGAGKATADAPAADANARPPAADARPTAGDTAAARTRATADDTTAVADRAAGPGTAAADGDATGTAAAAGPDATAARTRATADDTTAVADRAAGSGTAAAAGPATGSGEVGSQTAGDRPWRRALLVGFGIFAASKIALAVVTAFAWIGEKRPNVTATYLAAQWASQWDSKWFVDIAQRGYYPEPDKAPAAFFPMYPMLIRGLTPICFGKPWVAALLVANLAAFGALVVLYRLTEREFDRVIAGRTVFYLVAFPTAFFLTAAYNEGLFIGLMLATLYCLRQQHWWWAGAFGGLAVFTRSAGILLAGAFVWEYVRVNRFRLKRSALAILLIPVGVAGVAAFSINAYGEPFAFLKAQRYWGRHLDWPWMPVLRGGKSLVTSHGLRFGFSDLWVHNLLELATALMCIAALVLCFVGPWKLRRDQWVLPLVGIGLTLLMISFPSSHLPYPLYSASRFGLEVFPAFMILARIGARPWVDRIVVALFFMLQAILAAYFVRGGWVA
ncbi:glycosyltransferase family 39 protein [Dactylosporangium sp. CS-033363]|uniref:glycosyltransferase family 39 protein n=1 Tax=Dactylosporangium sp. CS-033363 TaxID=3239935 RepID=UPI003D92B7F2